MMNLKAKNVIYMAIRNANVLSLSLFLSVLAYVSKEEKSVAELFDFFWCCRRRERIPLQSRVGLHFGNSKPECI
jgi:hypothetical protein